MRACFAVLFVLLLASSASAQPVPVPLWQDGAPGAVGDAPEDQPTVTPFLPDFPAATGAAVVVFPGGGYSQVVKGKEGAEVAEWLNALGIAAFVVEYRVGPRYHHPAMLQDAQRAVRVVRARADEWDIDPERVAAMGFSAGGHLAALLATEDGSPDLDAEDPVERLSARPDLLLLTYPVVTLQEPWAHAGSRTHLLGADPDSALVRALSAEVRVTEATPPTFLVSGADDTVVPVENTLMLYSSLREAGVPAELHVFESAPHGFGPNPDDPAIAIWKDLAAQWLGRHGWCEGAPKARVASGANIAVHLIGDSTMSDKDVRSYPETGWGTPFKDYFDASVTVENHARNGRSTRTFLEEGRWQPVVENLQPGDYVFIQFGHNDEVPTKEQSTTPEQYVANLERYVRETREAGAQPVLLTPIARRHFDAAGRLEDTHAQYSQLVREVALEHDVPLIDMDRRSQALLRELGDETSRFLYLHLEPGQNPNYPEGVEDDTHFSELGARRMAELVLHGLRELDLSLASRIVESE